MAMIFGDDGDSYVDGEMIELDPDALERLQQQMDHIASLPRRERVAAAKDWAADLG